jgi:iron complex transport system ATP-binding protein
VIRLQEVTVRFGDSVAVDDVTDTITRGEWIGVIGPNGAGKTSLLRACAHLLPYDGTIAVDGQEMGRLSRRRLAQLVAFVPQQPEMPPDMTVADYVLLGRTPHIGFFASETPTDRRICSDLLDRLELAGHAGRHLATLSGGELQRLVLARALAQQAPVLLLDEPTSALDLGRRIDALELVDQVRREHGLTVLSAMHDLTLAGQFADRLLLLDGGRAVANGSAANVLTSPILAVHYGAEVHVLTTPEGHLVVVPRRAR